MITEKEKQAGQKIMEFDSKRKVEENKINEKSIFIDGLKKVFDKELQKALIDSAENGPSRSIFLISFPNIYKESFIKSVLEKTNWIDILIKKVIGIVDYRIISYNINDKILIAGELL